QEAVRRRRLALQDTTWLKPDRLGAGLALLFALRLGTPHAHQLRMPLPQRDYSWYDLRVRADKAMREARRIVQSIRMVLAQSQQDREDRCELNNPSDSPSPQPQDRRRPVQRHSCDS